MNIIIVGEFSSFARNLSEGFRSIGHNCFVFSWGDGFKQISQANNNSYCVCLPKIGRKSVIEYSRYILKAIIEYKRLHRKVRQLGKDGKWDYAIVVNPVFIQNRNSFWQVRFTKGMFQKLLHNPDYIFFSACGGDVPFFDYWKDRNWKNHHLVEVGLGHYYSLKQKEHFQYCGTFINKVIPIAYMYAQAWRESAFSKQYKVFKTIPLPVNTSLYKIYNAVNNKIVIFHGIIRPEEKGTPIILDAMKRIQEKYPDKVECIAKGGLPLEEYLPILNRTNILIDQVYSDTVGMNGLYAMAMGKVVLGGNERENRLEYNVADCPVINIKPDSNQIFKELESLILDVERIKQLSLKSRQYVERVHDAQIVAQNYIDLFIHCN